MEAGEIFFTTGRRRYDLMLGVPPHRCPQVVVESGLTNGKDWVNVDPRTLETRFPDVYVIGDVTLIHLADGKPHPKAGVFAEAQGQVVAERIAARLSGREPEATYTGEGYCFLEVGGGEAMLVRGHFMASPVPEVTLTDPSAGFLAEKESFETERLERWFGA